MTSRRLAAGLIGAAILALLPWRGALADPAPLTLDRAINQAVAANPEIRAAQGRIEAARAREIQAATWPNPNLGVDADEVPIQEPLGGRFKVGLSQPILVGPHREARMRIAEVERELAILDLDVLRRDLAARVEGAYVKLLFAREDLKRSRLAHESAEAIVRASEARLKAGAAAPVEVLQAQVEASRTRLDLTTAELRLRTATGRLAILLGMKAGEPIVVADLAPPGASELPSPSELIESGLRNRLELRRASLLIEREALQKRLAQAGIWTGTEVSLNLGVGEGRAFLGSGLTIPLPLYRQQGEIREAEANQARAEAERATLEGEISLAIQEAHATAMMARQHVELFCKTYLPQAEQLLDNARRRYQAGEGTGIDVAQAHRALRETSLQREQAILEYREALVQLERASGVRLLR